MRVTDRDLTMLKWINGFGFVTVEQVCRWMGVVPQVGRRRLKKLETMGFIERERLFFQGGSIVRVTKEGVKVSGDTLGRKPSISLGVFDHDRQLIDLSLNLTSEHPESWFWPERRIRHEFGLKGYGEKGHVADGFLVTADGDKFAIELELNRKQRGRLRKIIANFQGDFDLKGVWYFCAPDVVDYVRDHVDDDDFFKVESWEGLANANG